MCKVFMFVCVCVWMSVSVSVSNVEKANLYGENFYVILKGDNVRFKSIKFTRFMWMFDDCLLFLCFFLRFFLSHLFRISEKLDSISNFLSFFCCCCCIFISSILMV